jgi:hypothetical protein
MHTPPVWITTLPDAPRPTTRRLVTPLAWGAPLRVMLRDAYAQAFKHIDTTQLRALEATAKIEGKAAAELDCQTTKGVPMRIAFELHCPDRFPDAPADDAHKPKLWRLSFDNACPPRVVHVRSSQHMGEAIREAVHAMHGLSVVQTFGPRFADMFRRATAEHTIHVTFRCEGADGRTLDIPVTLTDEDATPLDVASLI